MSNIRRFVRTFPELEFRQRDKTMRSILARKGVQSDRAFISFLRFAPSAIIMRNFNTMLRMETNMWVLSTLGGGYSALADCGLRQFAEKALEVSRIQIELARNLGDQVMLARCYIYVGYAFTQLGRLCDAFKIFIYVRSLARRLKSELLDGLTIALFIKIDQAALKQDDPITSTSKFKYFHEKFC
ncbi:hypothetical protein M3Y99_00324200 [Aphelenchoides fujianensis]|nr:hypothetical protein M3Y99_00324200 [Aphelenchoides fujianensis]